MIDAVRHRSYLTPTTALTAEDARRPIVRDTPAVASGAGAPDAGGKDAKIRSVAGQLEALFVQQLFKAMRETVPQQEGIVSGGAGEEMFTGLLDQRLAAETPKQWSSGITDALYRQLRGAAGARGAASDVQDPNVAAQDTALVSHSLPIAR